MSLPITINDLLVKSDKIDIDLEFFNSRFRAIMSALTNIDARMLIYDAQSASLVELGLQRLNDSMGPMLATLTEASNLGFLVCKSAGTSRQLTLGSAIGWTITTGADIFTPTPFVLAQDDTDSTNWGILSIDAGGWVPTSATLATHVAYAAKTQASSAWTISANSAFVPAMQTMLSQSQTARDQAVAANSSVTSQMATLNAAITAIQSGPVSSVAGKTGAVTLVEADIANLSTDLAAKATNASVTAAVAGKQDSSAKLTTLAAMTWAANQILMATGAGTISTVTASSLGLNLLAAASIATALTALNISAFMQTHLDDADASTALSTLGVSSFIKTLLDDADAATARSTLGITGTGGIATMADAASTTFDATNGSTSVARLSANGNRTITAPTNAADGQKVIIEHTAAGGATRTLTLTTGSAGAFRFGTDITALSPTVAGKIDRIAVIYNAAAQRWDCTGYVKGF